jgi:hypothetical protein
MSEKLAQFEETITLNVGGMLKDLNDVKLQLSAGIGSGGGSKDYGGGGSGPGVETKLYKFENEIMNLKDKIEAIN